MQEPWHFTNLGLPPAGKTQICLSDFALVGQILYLSSKTKTKTKNTTKTDKDKDKQTTNTNICPLQNTNLSLCTRCADLVSVSRRPNFFLLQSQLWTECQCAPNFEAFLPISIVPSSLCSLSKKIILFLGILCLWVSKNSASLTTYCPLRNPKKWIIET